MNEKTFLSELRLRLIENGVGESDADKYADQFKRYFDNLTEEEISEQIAALGSMESVVGNLIALIESKKEKEPSEGNATDSDDDVLAAQNGEYEKTVEIEAIQTDEITIEIPKIKSVSVKETGDDEFISIPDAERISEKTPDIAADEEISSLRANRAPRVICGNTKIGLRSDSYSPDIETSEITEEIDDFSTEAYNAAYNAAHSDDEYIIESETASSGGTRTFLKTKKGRLPARGRLVDDYDDYYDDDDYESDRGGYRSLIYKGPKRQWAKLESESGKKRFWGILLGTLPITIPLAAAVVALFCCAFLALWAVIAALILLLASTTVIGSAFSLVSVIYGVTQLFTVFPIGLYEIGIGIVSSGITMLVGILIYNADVRAMPYAIRYLIRFFFYCIDCVKGAVYKFREECAKIK